MGDGGRGDMLGAGEFVRSVGLRCVCVYVLLFCRVLYAAAEEYSEVFFGRKAVGEIAVGRVLW